MNNRYQSLYRDILRNDLMAFAHRAFLALNPNVPFAPHPFLEVLAYYLEKVLRGEIKRLIVNMPPRSLKSHFCSVVFPAWYLGHKPSAQIMTVSYGQDLADRMARECRSLMTMPFYEALFDTRLTGLKLATAEFETAQKGYRLSTSIGGALTGRGADVVVIDDPLKPDEALSDACRAAVNEWYENTLFSRLNDKANGAVVLVMQRLHEDDLVGHLLAKGEWTVLSFPAIAESDQEIPFVTPYGPDVFRRRKGEALHPAREPLETLAEIKATISPYDFAGQYQQAPAPYGGGIVKEEWLKFYDALPVKFDSIVQSWDTASVPAELNSYSVCTTWGVSGPNRYLIHVRRERLDFAGLKDAVREQARDFRANVVLIENKASGIPLIQELLRDGVRGITKYEPSGDKVMRMHAQAARFSNGFVYLPRQAHWLAEYVHELVTFPRGRHSDQVDSTSQALDWITQGGTAAGYVEYYEREAEKLRGVKRYTEPATMRAPGPHQRHFMSGDAGRAGDYTSNEHCIIENVHPEDIERMLNCGCVIVEKPSA